MTGDTPLAAFKATLTSAEPPGDVSAALLALWHAARGDWQRAHELAQSDHSVDGAWVHAHLHRVEGDLPNARYWYRQANRAPCDDPLAREWDTIAAALLDAREARTPRRPR